MKRKILIVLTALLISFNFNVTTASAALSNYQMFATSSGFATYLNSITRLEDSVRLNFGPGKVYYYTLGIYAQSSYNSNDHTYQTSYIGSSSGLISARLKCDAYWNVRIYDSSKNKKATVKLVTYNTGNGPCSIEELDKEHPNTLPPATEDNPNPQPEPETETDEDVPVEEGTGNSCADVTCKCIENMTDALLEGMDKNADDIVEAIENGDKNIVTAINKNTAAVVDGTEKIVSAVNKVTKAVNDLHDEFKTDKTYKIKDIKVPDLDMPENQPDKKFVDDTEYFKDQGDKNAPGSLPSAVDVEDWDGVQRQDDDTKDEEMSKSNEMTKDNMNQESEMSKSNEMTKDNMNQESEMSKSNEMTKDNMNQESEMSKSNEMTKDNMNQESEMSKSNEMTKDNMNQDNQYNQTHIYQKAPSMEVKDVQ